MVSSDSDSRPEPVDPVYDALFRPAADPLPPEPDDEPMFEQVLDPVVDPRDEAATDEPPGSDDEPPVLADPADSLPVVSDVDTGRLFRSQGVTDTTTAVLAVSRGHGGRLRTLERASEEPPAVAPQPGAVPVIAMADLHRPDDVDSSETAAEAGTTGADEGARRRGRSRTSAGHSSGSRTISAGAVYLIVIGGTMLIGFANALLSGGGIGWPTGLALLVTSVYCALTVRREDDAVTIFTPPIAFFLAAVTAGQAFRGASGGGLLNRAQLVFFSLADNWYWVIGATLAATVIVIVRRRRA